MVTVPLWGLMLTRFAARESAPTSLVYWRCWRRAFSARSKKTKAIVYPYQRFLCTTVLGLLGSFLDTIVTWVTV